MDGMNNDGQWQIRIQRAVDVIPKEKFPLIIELAGMPRLGKTTFTDSLLDFFKKSGFIAKESSFATHASPIDDRWSFDFSAWTLLSTLKNYLEQKHLGTQFLVADRGIFDAIVWLRMKLERGLIDKNALSTLRALTQLSPWNDSLCSVIAFVGDEKLILSRFQERRLYEGDSLVTTKENISSMRNAIREEANLWNQGSNRIEVFEIKNEGLRDVMLGATESVVCSIEQFAKRDSTK